MPTSPALIKQVIHVIPSHESPDGVADYQKMMVSQLVAREQDAENRVQHTMRTMKMALGQKTNPVETLYHFQLPMRGWRMTLWVFLYPLLLKLLKRKSRIILTLHEWGGSHWIRQAVNLPFFFFIDDVICPTSDIANDMESFAQKWRSRLKNHIFTIPIGPNLLWSPEDHTEDPIEDWAAQQNKHSNNTSEQEHRIGYFGFLYPAKRPLLMLDIIKRLRQSHPMAKLVVIGDFLEEFVEPKTLFKEKIEALKLGNNLEWHGYLKDDKDVLAALAGCDSYLLMNERGFTERNGSLLTCLQFGKTVFTSPPKTKEHKNPPDWIKELLASKQLVFLNESTTGQGLSEQGEEEAVKTENECEAIVAQIISFLDNTKEHQNTGTLPPLWDMIVTSYNKIYH